MSDSALLGTENLKEILDLTWNCCARWRFIGIELGIDVGTLDAINVNNRKVEDCLREMITIWLRRHKPKPSRHAIITALQSGRVSSTVGNCHVHGDPTGFRYISYSYLLMGIPILLSACTH